MARGVNKRRQSERLKACVPLLLHKGIITNLAAGNMTSYFNLIVSVSQESEQGVAGFLAQDLTRL